MQLNFTRPPVTTLPIPTPMPHVIHPLPGGPMPTTPPLTTLPVPGEITTLPVPRPGVDGTIVPPHGPIGVGSFGTVRIGHALNGIAYTTHQLSFAITRPAGVFHGSFKDAVSGAQALAASFNATTDGGRAAYALVMGQPGEWTAMQLDLDAYIVRAFENGAGHGGIASIDFPSRSRSLAAIVTERGAVDLLSKAPVA